MAANPVAQIVSWPKRILTWLMAGLIYIIVTVLFIILLARKRPEWLKKIGLGPAAAVAFALWASTSGVWQASLPYLS